MKRLLGVLMLLLLFLGCNTANTSDTITESVKPNLSLNGRIVEDYNDEFLPIPEVALIINSNEVSVDSNATFKYPIEEGQYIIEILSNEHEPFLDTIDVLGAEDINLQFELTPIMADVYPLEVGLKWKYDYFYQDLDAPIDVINRGVVHIEILEKEVDQDTISYKAREIFEYKKIYYFSQFSDGTKNDTLEYRYDNLIEIKESKDFRILASGGTSTIAKAFNGTGLFYYPSKPEPDDINDFKSLRRFVPFSRFDNNSIAAFRVLFDSYSYAYLVKPDSGIVTFTSSSRAGLWSKYELLEFSN